MERPLKRNFEHPAIQLVLASFLMLFAEIMAIRWLAIEHIGFRLMPNLVLIIAFIGGSAGMAQPKTDKVSCIKAAAGSLLLTVMLSFAPLLNPAHWTAATDAGTQTMTVVVVIVTMLLSCFCLVMMFRMIGSLMGAAFQQLSALEAYSINLLGSLIGIVMFALLSFLNLGPFAWMIVCCSALLLILRNRSASILCLVLSAATLSTLSSAWSPYRKVDIRELRDPSGVTDIDGSFFLYGNNFFYQSGMKLPDPETLAKLAHDHPDNPRVMELARYQKTLDLPYTFARSHEKVLVLGAGVGNDVLYALQKGSSSVDAVELDPVIARLGEMRHPSQPYRDRRVHLFVDDARSYLRTTKKKYDLINFCFIDPGHAGVVSSFMRVDNFVYTVEAFRAALKHLEDDGVVVVSFSSPLETMGLDRVYSTIWKAIGHPPAALKVKKVDIGNVSGTAVDKAQLAVFAFGPGLKKHAYAADAVDTWPKDMDRPSTDDWPFLYLKLDIPPLIVYFAVLFKLVAVSLALSIRPKLRDVSQPHWWSMSFMGMAFMLLEAKACTQLSLAFGTTWIASSAAIAAILLLAWLANQCVMYGRTPRLSVLYICLAASLIANYFWTIPESSQMPSALIGLWASLVNCLPIFFSSLIFSRLLSIAHNPSLAFSANLLGVAFGGVAENLSLAFGLRALSLVALLIYLISFWGAYGHQRQSSLLGEASKAGGE
ncbi:MAG TPA: hypothetical protein V6D17_09115 [Candidatus Obscuribacterales bacterium]